MTIMLYSNHFYFETEMRNQIATQEVEMREQLQTHELDCRKLQLQKIGREIFIEKLRPLCEELPIDLVDPISFEAFTNQNIPGVLKCGHVFNRETIQNIVFAKHLTKDDGIPCPLCRMEGRCILECLPLENITEHMQKISTIFQEKYQG